MKEKYKKFKTKLKKIIGVCFGYVIGFLLLFSILCVSFAPMMVGAVNVNYDEVIVINENQSLQMYNNNFSGTVWTLTNMVIPSEALTIEGLFYLDYDYGGHYNYRCQTIRFGYRYDEESGTVVGADNSILIYYEQSVITSGYTDKRIARLNIDTTKHVELTMTAYYVQDFRDFKDYISLYFELNYVPSCYNTPINLTVNCDYPDDTPVSKYFCYILGDDPSYAIYPDNAIYINQYDENNQYNLNINTIVNPSNYYSQYNCYGYRLNTRFTGAEPVLKVCEYGTDRIVQTVVIDGTVTELYISPQYYYVLDFVYDASASTKHSGITLLIDDVDLGNIYEYYYHIGQSDGGHYYLFNEYMPPLVTYTDDDYGQGIYFDFTDALGREYTQMYFVRNEYTYELYGDGAYAIAYRKQSNDLLVHVYNSRDGWMHPAYKLIHTYVDFNDGTWVSLEKDYILLNSTDNVDPSNLGFILGESNGYDKGFDAGSSESFGENVLGSTLSAPIRAINEFVLFSVGGVDVTLGGIFGVVISLSLFILFLKMFAGG